MVSFLHELDATTVSKTLTQGGFMTSVLNDYVKVSQSI